MVIFLLKVLKLTNKGSQDVSSPLAFAEGLFVFVNFLQKKKDLGEIYGRYLQGVLIYVKETN
jgi:hypothetical protein